jgi:hypothetical protein
MNTTVASPKKKVNYQYPAVVKPDGNFNWKEESTYALGKREEHGLWIFPGRSSISVGARLYVRHASTGVPKSKCELFSVRDIPLGQLATF